MKVDNVLVVGATGLLGRHLVPALSERGKNVHVLIRKSTLESEAKAKEVDSLRRQGVTFRVGDLGDTKSLRNACQGIDAVISTVGGGLMLEQANLFAPMKEAGVKRFIPSDFGAPSSVIKEGRVGLFDTKRRILSGCKTSGVPYTAVHANCFSDYWTKGLGQLGESAPTMTKVNVYGSGNTKAHILTLEDIATVAAHTVDDPRTENRSVLVCPDNCGTTQNQLIDLWENVSGKTIERNPVSAEELDQTIEELSKDADKKLQLVFSQLLAAVWIDGAAEKHEGMLEASSLYPSLAFMSIKDVLSSMV